MKSVYESLFETVCRFLSSVNARAILNQVLTECQRSPADLVQRDLRLLTPKLERALAIFLDATQRAALRAEIEALALGTSPTKAAGAAMTSRRITIRTEQDITEARSIGRQMCIDLKARSFNVQKVATVVSELARNIVNYSKGGYVELIPQTSTTPPSVTIIATDTGPGIKNLDVIMSGRYRSNTGLGLGILGTKRLADHFAIDSSERGTRIEAGVRL
jgi:serine/threonine-protein kinase RsbT